MEGTSEQAASDPVNGGAQDRFQASTRVNHRRLIASMAVNFGVYVSYMQRRLYRPRHAIRRGR